MTRWRWPVLLAAVVMVASGCGGGPTWTSSAGRIDADDSRVEVPSWSAPAVSPDAGFVVTTAPAPTVRQVVPLVRVAAAEVSVGDQVTAGQPLVRLDDAPLTAAVAAAKADAAVARAQVAVLDQRLADAADSATSLQDKRKEAEDALAELRSTRTKLVDQLALARSTLPTMRTNRSAAVSQLTAAASGLAQVDAAIGALPPGIPVPADLAARRSQLAAAVANLTAGIAQLDAGIAQLTTAIPELERGIAQVDDGIAQLNDGLAQLGDADAAVADAREQLTAVRALAVVGVGAADVAVIAAEQQASLAVLVARVSGRVVSVAGRGDVLAPGAAAVVVRPETRTAVTWVGVEHADAVCAGDAVNVRTGATTYTGRVERVGDEAEYPPSWLSTTEVHLVRGVRVTVALDRTDSPAPAGAPADIQLTPCRGAR